MARLDLSDHPKFKRLARAVRSRIIATGLLEAIWQTAYMLADPYIGVAEDVAETCDWPTVARLIEYPGDPDVLIGLLKTCGFLDEPVPGQYVVHDLFDHAPAFVRARWVRNNPYKTPPWLADARKATSAVHTNSKGKCTEYKNSNAAALRSAPAGTAEQTETPNPRVLAKAAHDELNGQTFDTETDLKEAVKDVAVQHRLPFTGDSLARTLDLLARSRRPLAAQLPDHVPRRRRA